MIQENLLRVQVEIAQAAKRVNRDPASIRLLAVSKRVEVEKIKIALQCGHNLFGENYIQEAVTKIDLLAGQGEYHFIGPLQSNKTKIAAEYFSMVQSVDRLKIAQKLNQHARVLNKVLPILVQVNIGEEASKSGVSPDKTIELAYTIQQLSHLKLKGLMTIPPATKNPEGSRPFFRQMYQLSEQLRTEHFFSPQEKIELSMGMSQDFTIAIEEGATLVRLGTILFGKRPPLPLPETAV